MMNEASSSDEGASAMLVSDPYYRKYMALRRRCQSLNQENQRLVNRVYHVQRLVRRARRQCHLVATRLDQHGDNYREAALRAGSEGAVRSPGGEVLSRPAGTSGQTPKSRLKSEKKQKRRLSEPKKPPNPFFQYCQEQRGQVLAQMKGQAPSGLSKSAVTKQLASNWSRMSAQSKQKYVDRYEQDKRQYALSLQQRHPSGVRGNSGTP